MSYCPSRHPLAGHLQGQFVEVSHGKWFEYALPDSHDTPFAGYEQRVFVGDHGETRWAKVLKTRALVVVDENADGSPVVERWVIRRHKEYFQN